MRIELTSEDSEAIRTAEPLKIPDETGIFAGARFLFSAKRGGDMELVTVTCRNAPYVRQFADGRKATYVDVFGWGVRESVNIKKLRVIPGTALPAGGPDNPKELAR